MQNIPSPRYAGQLPVRSFLFVLLVLFSSIPAFGSLTVCNHTDQKVFIALGYQENGRWFSRGWWTAEAGECVQLLPSLSGREYYLYAYRAEGGRWAGQTPFCTAENNFTLEKGAGCSTKFFRIDTQGQTQWTHFLRREGGRYFSEGTGRCDLVSALAKSTTHYIERFANQFLASPLAKHQEVAISPEASFQFALVVNGSVRAIPGPARYHDRDLVLELPLRIVGARVRWREESEGRTNWRLDKIPDQTASVKVRLRFQYQNGQLNISTVDYLQWTREPFYYFRDQKIALSQLIQPALEPPLQQMNGAWQNRFRPIFDQFERQDCTWKQEVAKAVQALEAFDRSREKDPKSRTGKSLAKRE